MSITPGVNDVLCGKGNAVASHRGNIHFRALIERHVVGYDSTPNSGVKRDLVERVRQGVRDANGRFLIERRDSPMYEEQSEGKVEKKIRQAFRDKIKSLNKSREVDGLRSSLDSTTTAPTSNMSRVNQADNAQIPQELSIPGMAYNQGHGLRSSFDSTITTSSLNTRRPTSNMSRVQPVVGNTQIPHELNTSSWMAYHDQGNSSSNVTMYRAEPPNLPFDRRRSSAMLAMRGSGSRNLSTETTEKSDEMQEHCPRVGPCSLSDNAHAGMRRGSMNLGALATGDGRNLLEPEGVGVEGSGRTQHTCLPQKNLEPPQSYDGSQFTRDELLRVIQLLGSSKSMDMSVSETNTKKAQYPRLLMKLANSNTSFHDLTESLKEIAVDSDEMFSLDAASLESLKKMMWRSNDSMLGDQSMRSILSQGEPSQKAEV